MNILVTAVGSFSGEAVLTSLKKNRTAKIVAADIYPKNWIAISNLADSFYQVPVAYHVDAYIESLLEVCQREKINFIIPLTDPEVDALSEKRKLFEKKGICICLSDFDVIRACRDKYVFYCHFKDDSKLNVIPTYELGEDILARYNFPLIAKPKTGRSSEGVFKINNEIDLNYIIHSRSKENVIIQPYFFGNVFTVDFVRNNSTGNNQSVCRQELVRTSNGAGLTVEVIHNREIEDIASHIGERLKINGCVNFEFIECYEKFFLMDINPRFSAGVAFSHLAGYDMVENHLNCFLNKDVQFNFEYSRKIFAKKYNEIIL